MCTHVCTCTVCVLKYFNLISPNITLPLLRTLYILSPPDPLLFSSGPPALSPPQMNGMLHVQDEPDGPSHHRLSFLPRSPSNLSIQSMFGGLGNKRELELCTLGGGNVYAGLPSPTLPLSLPPSLSPSLPLSSPPPSLSPSLPPSFSPSLLPSLPLSLPPSSPQVVIRRSEVTSSRRTPARLGAGVMCAAGSCGASSGRGSSAKVRVRAA